MTDPNDEMMEVVETITFLPDGGSKHVWRFPDGTTLEKTFDVSPVLFLKRGEFGFDTAAERGITSIIRHTKP